MIAAGRVDPPDIGGRATEAPPADAGTCPCCHHVSVGLFRRRTPWYGDCPECGHDWREHVAEDGECSECVYEIDHAEPGAPAEPCAATASGPAR